MYRFFLKYKSFASGMYTGNINAKYMEIICLAVCGVLIHRYFPVMNQPFSAWNKYTRYLYTIFTTARSVMNILL